MENQSHIALRQTTVQENRSSADVWLLAGCFAGLYVVIGLIVNHFVLTPDVLNRTWLEAGMEAQIEEFSARQATWRLFGYVLTPIFVVIKIGFTAVCISVGCALMYWDVRFLDLFRVSTQAEIVWAVVAVIHLACVLYVIDIETMTDYSTFYPLSALNLADLGEDDLWAAYLFKTINLFEVAYVGALAAGLRQVIRKPLARLISLVLFSYGGGTLLLVSAVTFSMMVLM